jgi:hypothetical protein
MSAGQRSRSNFRNRYHAVTRHGPECRRQGAGLAVGDVLKDDRHFREPPAVVELEQRDIAFGVDLVIVGVMTDDVLAEVDADEIELRSRFAQGDVSSERASAG